MIVVGKRITRGALRGIEEGTQFDLYNLYGRDWLNNRFLAMVTFNLAEFLEDNGWESIPMANLPPQIPPMGIPVRENQPPPNVLIDLEDAAVRAGVGEIGYCGILLTPQFGPRQRIQLIITDAELKADPILTQNICDGCIKEKEICPLGAISLDEKVISICGKDMTVGDIDFRTCKSCKNGAHPNPHHATGRPDRLSALCVRNCIENLEKKGIGGSFENPFRKREPWKVV